MVDVIGQPSLPVYLTALFDGDYDVLGRLGLTD